MIYKVTDVVTAGEQQSRDIGSDLHFSVPQFVQQAFHTVGKTDYRIQTEQPGRTLDSVGSAKDRIQAFLFVILLFQMQ